MEELPVNSLLLLAGVSNDDDDDKADDNDDDNDDMVTHIILQVSVSTVAWCRYHHDSFLWSTFYLTAIIARVLLFGRSRWCIILFFFHLVRWHVMHDSFDSCMIRSDIIGADIAK